MGSFLETVPAMLGGVATLQRTFIMTWTKMIYLESYALVTLWKELGFKLNIL